MSETGLLLAEIQTLKRRIQSLETVSEHPGFAASDVARLSQNNTFAGIQTIPNTGLHLLDTNGSHDLIIAPGSDLSADVTLSLVMTANRTLTLNGNLTVPATGTAALLATANVFTALQTIQNGSVALKIGADSGATTLTNATDKYGRVGVPHYTNSEEPVGVLAVSSTSTVNQLIFGGGTSAFNAATLISFHTAANNTTTTGTERMRIASNGHMSLLTAADYAALTVNQSDSGGAVAPLYLGQADIDQPMLELAGTSAASAAASISSWTTGQAIQGLFKIRINGTDRWIPFYTPPTA